MAVCISEDGHSGVLSVMAKPGLFVCSVRLLDAYDLSDVISMGTKRKKR